MSLEIDDQAQRRFDRERAAFFPPERTVLGAHVTLFHALPAGLEPEVIAELTEAAAAREPFSIEVCELMSLGRGVAYRLRSAELVSLRHGLAARWQQQLTPQDRQGYRPHVTVQNKVGPEVARRTLAELSQRFAPFTVTARALRLWRYDGGPWTFRHRFPLGHPRVATGDPRSMA
ncbi:2'-5' RNA ligase family protein [Jatrophihabitans sp.]|uniref:2'-5' RNA ligase family protein n=1 Tax=Jatrophihabitans sp. TaxID=1932789 RepID=UPI002F01ACFE